MCCSSCSCSVNSVAQLLLEVYGNYLNQSGGVGPYHGHLANLHSLVVNQGGTDASAEALVRQLVDDKVLHLTDDRVPQDDKGHIRVEQDDAQSVLWVTLGRLAREVGLGCMLLL